MDGRSGGLELLAPNALTRHEVDIRAGERAVVVRDVMLHVRDHVLVERQEMFVQEGSVRPGILVLVDDTDWELLGGLDAPVAEGATVVFISTLHGG